MIPVADQVALAVAYERERCAMIAEAHDCDSYDCACSFDIAAKIRRGESQNDRERQVALGVAAEPVVSVVVLLNPTTKQPTCFEPNEATSRIFYGPYQNVTRVTKEWQDAERKAFDSQEDRERQHLREMMAG